MVKLPGTSFSGNPAGGTDIRAQHALASRQSAMMGVAQEADVGGYRPHTSQEAQYAGPCASVYGSAALSGGQQGKGSDKYVCELCEKHGKGENSVLLQNNQMDLKLAPGKLESTEEESEPFHDNEVPIYELSRIYVNGHNSKLRILCLHGFRQNASGFKGRTASLAKKLRNIAKLIFVDAPHELPFIYQPTESSPQQNSRPSDRCKRRFAWLVSPNSTSTDQLRWRTAKEPFDSLQYQDQTDGVEESCSYLQDLISRIGPFDGVLGFSQGAAMAALFCQELQRRGTLSNLKFAILCSGFCSVLNDKREVIKFPSLHVFGGGKGSDGQISSEASRELYELFDENCSVIIEHGMGHIIPTRSPFIDQMKTFFMGFL